ncbi:hypothetical protein [Pontibacillus litoralis]|uniref:Uncharacterized protein n=1 Tax=Pontibacillus litoralis JSM 072002 TaxID=1385512 RepID=A0A0A5G0K5_9BACI|nr:hypothetical protein [Pontibacillus litoralis]KGX86636.1 hypothetical protein N784_04230 [Pontibacillus litoralis JSM 072002]
MNYCTKASTQIRLYGKHDVSVMNGVLEALYKIVLVNDQSIRRTIWNFALYILDGMKEEAYHKGDLDLIRKIACNLAQNCGEESAI